jgi:hypothetical protein
MEVRKDAEQEVRRGWRGGRETKLLYGEGVGRDAGVWAGEREAREGKGWDG